MLVDPKGGEHARYAGADLFMPDLAELAEATGQPVGTEEEIAAAAIALRAAHGFGAVLVIRGQDGVTLVSDEGAGETVSHFPSHIAEVVDPAGAGDAVVAVAAAATAAGLPIGIVTRAEAAERVERWRRSGCRVGFLAGDRTTAADIIVQARSWCDRLVIALSDTDPEAGRLAELAGVDLVARFGGDTPADLIRLLRPDVLVQAPDPATNGSRESDLVQEWGGTVRRPGPLPTGGG